MMMWNAIKFFIFLLLPAVLQAQIVVHPQPQQAVFSGQYFNLAPAYRLTGTLQPDESAKQLLQSIVTLSTDNNAALISLTALNTTDEKLQRSGAYIVSLSPQQVSIQAHDERGIFYALQTLSQLVKQNNKGVKTLPVGTITDYPDVAYRGTVEGFYGQPWSHQDRLEQLRFYGRLKLNTYIYGPKDDPYHSSPHWRDAYPAEAEKQMRQLVQEANNNKVNFVWSIHPGQDIQWNKADSAAVLQKFEKMYLLGVRAFAVFFDDISGAGTDARKQAGLLNYLQQEFVEKKKDVLPLIMCPTEYNRGWANKTEGSYLDILGEELHPSIMIMWTGNTVVADITKEGQQWVNRRLRRPSFVWWNFPVSDYVRDHLLLGPAYGLDTAIAHEMSGFVSNPMDKAEASKPAIFSVAAYTWNMKSYEPAAAWQAALHYVMPEAPEAFQLFASHNSDPGPNGHRYRRYESVQIKPAVDSFLVAFEKGLYDKATAIAIQNEFRQLLPVAAEIQGKSKNKRLVEQLQPWLLQFHLLARSGVEALQMADSWHKNDKKKAWLYYMQLSHLIDSMQVVDKTLNQNPYQPGVETGSLVLTPLVHKLHRLTGQAFATGTEIGLANAAEAATSSFLFTNVKQLEHQPLQSTNNSLAITPLLEVVPLQPQAYAGIALNALLQADSLHFTISGGKLSSWAQFEKSADGKQWMPLKITERAGNGQLAFSDTTLKFVRFRNISDKVQSVNLRAFKVSVKPVTSNKAAVFALDGSITTYEAITAAKPLKILLPQAYQQSQLVFLMQPGGEKVVISGITSKGKTRQLYKGNEAWVVLKKSGKRKYETLQVTTESSKPVLLYEVVRMQ